VILGPLFALATAAALAQDPQGPPPAPPQGEALRVFLDCRYECDETFLRTEITFVNYVRDRFDAQLLVLVTTQQTGGRGTDFTLTFIGQREFQGRSDTLHHIARQGNTADETRRGFARVLRLGLIPFTMKTPLAEHLDVRYTPPAAPPRELRDPWHRWVFRTSVRTFLTGEQSTAYNSFSGSFSASRETEDWRLVFDLDGNRNRSRNQWDVPEYDSLGNPVLDNLGNIVIDTTIVLRTTKENWGASALIARSLGAHWSAGLQAEVSGSTSRNIHSRLMATPAIEWDYFPYAQSTRRQLTLRYAVGIEAARYRDTTLYGEVAETFGRHSLGVALVLVQPWGRANVSLSGTQYWNDARNPNVDLYGSMNVRIVRGFSVNVSGGYSFVRSQRYLQAGTASSSEVLLQLRQLRTSFEYWGSFGLSYTFGSVYNNVVNPRFGGGGGNMIIMN
jgi:hypothetical protein